MTSRLKATPIRESRVWLRQVQGENALLNTTIGTLHLLNDSALAIWNLCDGRTAREEMVAAVSELFGLHCAVVEEDVDRVLGEFHEAGLIDLAGEKDRA